MCGAVRDMLHAFASRWERQEGMFSGSRDPKTALSREMSSPEDGQVRGKKYTAHVPCRQV